MMVLDAIVDENATQARRHCKDRMINITLRVSSEKDGAYVR